jgi:putative copper resistance protein D
VAALVACLVLVGALVAGGGRPAAGLAGLPDAGPMTGWGLPLLRLASTISAVGTIGLLLMGAVLVASPGQVLTSPASAALRASARWAAAWCALTAGLLLLTASDTTGVPLTGVSVDAFVRELTSSRGRPLLLVAVVSGAVAVGVRRTSSRRAALAWLAVSLTALLPTTVTGHAATAADHDLATTALVVHVVAATLWVGGLLAVLLQLRLQPVVLSQAVARFSVVALACFAAVGVSGACSAWIHLGRPSQSWLSGYGGLLLTKAVALVLLGAFGWEHRRRMLPALAAGRPRAFLTFAAAELAVMAAALGLAVALSRTPVPAVTSIVPLSEHGTGHGTPAATVPPLTLSRLLLEWRPDALVLVLLGLLLAAYVAAVRSLRASGGRWPWWRLVTFTAGTSAALIALCGGLATYAAAQVSAQLAQFLLLLLVAPALLVHGAPFTLWSEIRRRGAPPRADSPRQRSPAGGALSDPLLPALLVVGLVLALYRTPVIELSLRSAWVHLLVNVLTLLVGVLVVRPAVDPLPSDGAAAERGLPLLAVAVTLALLAGQLGLGDQLLAGRWFLALDGSSVDPVADQRAGALLVAGTTAAVVPVLALSLALRSTALDRRRRSGPGDRHPSSRATAPGPSGGRRS